MRMIAVTELRKEKWQDQIPMRSQFAYDEVNAAVKDILADVEKNGDAAVKRYNQKFDHADTPQLEVSKEEIRAAFDRISKELQVILQEACDQIRRYHEKQLKHDFMIHEQQGIVLGQLINPIEKVGIYVPGGTAAYPSTVLMNAVPAKLAGVEELILVSPPSQTGEIADMILAAAYVAGVDKVFRVGGAQAIAALSYGTESIPKVYKIVGPGNIYVAMAKKMVFGQVDIDMIAGPSEILIVADDSADPSHLAADLLSQAEHDKLACAILVTDSLEIAEKTEKELQRQLKELPRREIAEASLQEYGRIFHVTSLAQAMEVANEIAPEHLEIYTRHPFDLLSQVKNAGSVFLGAYAPESLGDYWAGPNHTLPTSGTAKFASPLSVDDFIKKSQITYYTKESLLTVSDKIAKLARAEGLEAHARAAEIRGEAR
jgi:histidinol dehydrogenase